MIIWQGWGILVPVIAILSLAIVQVIVDAIMSPGYYSVHEWSKFLGGVVTALALWFIGKRLNSKPGRILVDEETNEKVELKSKHSLFWIPMQYWSIIALIFMVIVSLDAP